VSKTFICQASELAEDTALGFVINRADNTSLKGFAVRKDGGIFAYNNACPHLGIPLEMEANKFLDEDNEYIECSMHGALFIANTGECIAGPCHGKFLDSLEVREENDGIYLIE